MRFTHAAVRSRRSRPLVPAQRSTIGMLREISVHLITDEYLCPQSFSIIHNASVNCYVQIFCERVYTLFFTYLRFHMCFVLEAKVKQLQIVPLSVTAPLQSHQHL